MNATLDLLATRRSVAAKLLTTPAPTDEQIQTLLTLAARVPDHGKVVPWRFIIIRPDAGAYLGEVIAATHLENDPDADDERLQLERNRLSLAPLVIAVVSSPKPNPKVPEWEQILSAGAVCMNLVIAANAMGFGTNWLTQWYAFDRRVLSAIGLTPTEQIAGFIHIGTATETPADRNRPALSDIVTEYRAPEASAAPVSSLVSQ